MPAAAPNDPPRAPVVLAAVVLAVAMLAAAVRRIPPGPERPWIEQPGIPVELAGDGVYFLRPPASVRALLAQAESECAAPARTLVAGDRVTVGAGCALRVDRMAGAARLTLGLRLDPNRDDADALAALPGVGPRLARAIVRDRTKHGSFRDLDALLRVSGIGPATLRGLRPVTLFPSPPTPLPRGEGSRSSVGESDRQP